MVSIGIDFQLVYLLSGVSFAVIIGLFLFVWKSLPSSQDINQKREEEEEEPAEEERQTGRRTRGALDRMQNRGRRRVGADAPAPATTSQTQAQTQPNRRQQQEREPERQREQRGQRAQREQQEPTEAEEAEEEEVKTSFRDEKTGARKGKKWLEKQERKEEKKKAREAFEEDKKKKKEKEEEEDQIRQQKKEEEEEERKKIELLEQQMEEEKKRKKKEDYEKWKSSMKVEAVGQFDQSEQNKKNNAILQYIKAEKIVSLEDLSVTYSLKTKEVLDLIAKFENEGKLTGVTDDRGKYIYITKEELQKLAAWIKKKGRVSIRDIATESRKIINLTKVEEE